jgi:poly-gamma-glutamate capsule biosynthesis protein CapA/YwtB (metallophosphatase superfamily)
MKQNSPTMRLMAVGDIMLGDSSHFLGRGIGTAVRAHGADFLFVHVRDLLSRADLFLFNLESPLSSINGVDYQTKLYRAPASASPSLKFGTVNVASLANNHILQHGPSLLHETWYYLEKEGIAGVGFSPNGRDDLRSRCLKIGDFTISIHCESLIKDCTGNVIDYSEIEERIVRSFSMVPADMRIVSLHWGDEFVPVPAPYQQQLAHRLVERGANLILGHHPHVVQPVEEYKGALIAYSLGNFIFDQRWGMEVENGAILDVVLSPGIQEWKLHHTKINHAYQPELFLRLGSGFQVCDDRLSQVYPGLTETQYQSIKSTYSRRYRLQMKRELFQHFWDVSADTWLCLLSNRWRKISDQFPY